MSGTGEADKAPNPEMAARARQDRRARRRARRFAGRSPAQIEAAAEIKSRIGWPARIPPRVDEVLARVAARAKEQRLDPDLARSLWTALVEWSIAYEERLMKESPDKKVDPA